MQSTTTATTIENTKKTKASEEMLCNEMTKKPRRIAAQPFADLSDPIFAMTEDEIRQSLSDWFDACDTRLQNQGYGWAYTPSVAKDFVKSGKIRTCLDYYKDKSAALLETDKALCEGLCNLHIFHIIAREWSARPTICYGSYETQVLLFVLKHATTRNKLDTKEAGKVLIRLLDLSHAYSSDYKWSIHLDAIKAKQEALELGETVEENEPKTPPTKPVDEPRMPKVPLAQQAAVAIFFFPNLQFLYKEKEQKVTYRLACDNIKQGVESFAEALQQLDPSLTGGFYGFSWSHMVAAQKALDHAINACDKSLSFRFHELKLHDKPLSIKQEMAYVINF